MGKQNEQYSRSFTSAESSNSQSPSIDQTRLRESLVPLGPPLDLSKFREAIAPLFENITILSRTNERTSQMTDMFRRMISEHCIIREWYQQPTTVLAIEYISKPAIEYYPKLDLKIEQKWSSYSIEDIMLRLATSLKIMKRNKSSASNAIRVARATFELGIKASWQVNLDPDFLTELKDLVNEAKAKLHFSIGHIQRILTELGPENTGIGVDWAVWGCIATSGIIYLGELTENPALIDSIALRSCLYWVLNNSPNLIGVEYVRQSGIDLETHFWFKTSRRAPKRRRPSWEDESDPDLGFNEDN